MKIPAATPPDPFTPAARLVRRFALALIAVFAIALAPAAMADRVMLLVDNSGSMKTSDANRLVPEAVSGFIRTLPADTEVGVIRFDARAELVQGLVPAGQFDDRTLSAFDYTGQYTDPSAAVERALYAFRQRSADAGGTDSMVLITDGVIDLGNPTASMRAEDWLLGELSTNLQAGHITVWAIALTDAADFRMLNRLTGATGGQYFRAGDASEVESAIARIGKGIAALQPERPAPDATPQQTARAAAPRTTATPEPTPVEPGTSAAAAAPATGPAIVSAPEAAAETSLLDNPRWWLAFALLASGILMLGWVSYGTWSARRFEKADGEPALEYFPECYLVDLQGVTDKPSHMLSSKYNMITRLQNPPADGINYIQVFRRQIGRRHALIEYRDFSFWITDQNSVNGSFLNGERLSRETRLKHGDRLRFHVYEFEFCVSDLALSNETLVDKDRAPAH